MCRPCWLAPPVAPLERHSPARRPPAGIEPPGMVAAGPRSAADGRSSLHPCQYQTGIFVRRQGVVAARLVFRALSHPVTYYPPIPTRGSSCPQPPVRPPHTCCDGIGVQGCSQLLDACGSADEGSAAGGSDGTEAPRRQWRPRAGAPAKLKRPRHWRQSCLHDHPPAALIVTSSACSTTAWAVWRTALQGFCMVDE